MTYRLRHPISGTVYAGLGDGTVEVTKDDVSGVFDMHGRWLKGELSIADPEMVRWVGTDGFTVASRHRMSFSGTTGQAAATFQEETP